MRRTPVRYLLIVIIWSVAYLDWLQPGWLQFGFPAAWNKPLTTQTTYDLGAGVRRSSRCAIAEAANTLTPDWFPDWAEVWNWQPGSNTKEHKTCLQKLREEEA
jgi:hypothetical protein